MSRELEIEMVNGNDDKSIDAESIIEGVEYNKKPHHDTLYVTGRQSKVLKSHVSVGGLECKNINSVSFSGVDVEVMPGTFRPIVCEKGDVFPLAKDWKNGEISHD
jgi:hypothetical protein